MAKNSRGFKATNAMIDKENGKIVEYMKDGVNVFFIENLLTEWNGIEGLNISITLNQDREPDETEY